MFVKIDNNKLVDCDESECVLFVSKDADFVSNLNFWALDPTVFAT